MLYHGMFNIVQFTVLHRNILQLFWIQGLLVEIHNLLAVIGSYQFLPVFSSLQGYRSDKA